MRILPSVRTWLFAALALSIPILASCGGSCSCTEPPATLASLSLLTPSGEVVPPYGGVAVTANTVRQFAVFKGGQKVESGLLWTAQNGSITSAGAYSAPAAPGKDRVEVRIQDGSGWWLGQDLDVVALPSIQEFSANPARVAAGGLSQLTASFTTDFMGSILQGANSLQWSGTSFGLDVHPAATTTYTLVVQNRAGDKVQRTATVETY